MASVSCIRGPFRPLPHPGVYRRSRARDNGHACALAILEATGDICRVSLRLGHQSLQTMEACLRADPAESLGAISEWRSPGLGKGQFKGVKDELMAKPSNV